MNLEYNLSFDIIQTKNQAYCFLYYFYFFVIRYFNDLVL